jgi:hypothetical protein
MRFRIVGVLISTLTVTIAAGHLRAQNLFSNPITGSTTSSSLTPYTTGQVVASNLTVSGISIGLGNTTDTANNAYRALSWNSPTLDVTDYFSWTLNPNSGFQIDFTSIQYDGQRTGNGPTSFALRSSQDLYTSNIGTAAAGNTTISLSAATYQNVTTPITFRLYAWGAVGSNEALSIQDFQFSGSVSPVPEPSTILAVTGCALFGLRRLQKRFAKRS